MEFAPILTCASCMIAMIAAGAIMKLKWGALAFVLCGIGLLVYEIIGAVKGKYSLKEVFDKRTIVVYLSFVVLAAYYFIYFHGHYVSGYDTFTHWGPAVKIMLHCDRLPAQWDPLTWHSSLSDRRAGI